jgi:hypothetical protein
VDSLHRDRLSAGIYLCKEIIDFGGVVVNTGVGLEGFEANF